MKKLLVIIPLLLATGPNLGSGGVLVLKDEGTSQGSVSSINCSGTGITCTRSGTTGTVTISGGSSSPLTAKGDLYTFTTVDARKAVGADGLCLKANSAEATGLEWAACSAGGGLSYAEAAAAVMGGF